MITYRDTTILDMLNMKSMQVGINEIRCISICVATFLNMSFSVY